MDHHAMDRADAIVTARYHHVPAAARDILYQRDVVCLAA